MDEAALVACLKRHTLHSFVADFNGDVVAALIAAPSQVGAFKSPRAQTLAMFFQLLAVPMTHQHCDDALRDMQVGWALS